MVVVSKKILERAGGWRNRICACGNGCHSPEVTPLIFPFLGQRIVFISEAPYSFPKEGCRTLRDFLEKAFLEGIREEASRGDGLRMPGDIFDSVFLTFRCLFSSPPREEDVERFLRCVYWTHAAKKSLKGLGSWERKKGAERCFRPTVKELREARPEFMVAASSIALRVLFRRGFRELCERQAEKVQSEEDSDKGRGYRFVP